MQATSKLSPYCALTTYNFITSNTLILLIQLINNDFFLIYFDNYHLKVVITKLYIWKLGWIVHNQCNNFHGKCSSLNFRMPSLGFASFSQLFVSS